MRVRSWLRGLTALTLFATALAASGVAAAGQTNLQETMPLLDVMFYLSVAGALITFVILVWALVKFRDPATKGRRYG